jgi:uncharacterized protein with PQ loop repeat
MHEWIIEITSLLSMFIFIPQMWLAYKHRKKLKDLSLTSNLLYVIMQIIGTTYWAINFSRFPNIMRITSGIVHMSYHLIFVIFIILSMRREKNVVLDN